MLKGLKCDALVEMLGPYIYKNMAWRERISHVIVKSDSKILIDIIIDNARSGGVSSLVW
jgi:hypothetical protein